MIAGLRCRCPACGQWVKVDMLAGLCVAACTGITCSTHARGIIGSGDTAGEALEDYKDRIEDAKTS